MAVKKKVEPVGNAPESTFTRSQILASQRYRNSRDLLVALLNDNQQYSHASVEALVEEFKKGKVK